MLINLKPSDFVSLEDFSKKWKLPSTSFRSNKHKTHREAWCAACLLKCLDLTSYLITNNPIEADSSDIFIKNSYGTIYALQIVEIAPQDPESLDAWRDAALNGYSNLKNETYSLIMRAVSAKEQKYSDGDKKNLNLIIYINPSAYEEKGVELRSSVFIHIENDVDLTKLRLKLTASKFASIILITGSEAVFLKGNQLQ